MIRVTGFDVQHTNAYAASLLDALYIGDTESFSTCTVVSDMHVVIEVTLLVANIKRADPVAGLN
jgi:hypothetical protein